VLAPVTPGLSQIPVEHRLRIYDNSDRAWIDTRDARQLAAGEIDASRQREIQDRLIFASRLPWQSKGSPSIGVGPTEIGPHSLMRLKEGVFFMHITVNLRIVQ